MFGISFAELLLIAVILLLVVGPEKLPETVRAISINLAKLRRFWSHARREIEREVGMDDIRREIHNAEVMAQLEETKKTLNKDIQSDDWNPQAEPNDNRIDRKDEAEAAADSTSQKKS